MRVAILLTLVLALPGLAADAGSEEYSAPPAFRPHPLLRAPGALPSKSIRQFMTARQRLLLDYFEFGKKVQSFLGAWEEWKALKMAAQHGRLDDRDLFLTEEELWESVDKSMRKLARTRMSKNYLLAAGELVDDDIDGNPSPSPPKGPITLHPAPPGQLMCGEESVASGPLYPQSRVPLTDEQREMVACYSVFLNKTDEFASDWVSWLRVHNRLMRSDVYDYRLFCREAELWLRIQTGMDALRAHRDGKSYVVESVTN